MLILRVLMLSGSGFLEVRSEVAQVVSSAQGFHVVLLWLHCSINQAPTELCIRKTVILCSIPLHCGWIRGE